MELNTFFRRKKKPEVRRACVPVWPGAWKFPGSLWGEKGEEPEHAWSLMRV